MYYETDSLILLDLEQDVREFLEEAKEAHMAMHSRSKSFKILQHMKKSFPDCEVTRKLNNEVYLICIREKQYETV